MDVRGNRISVPCITAPNSPRTRMRMDSHDGQKHSFSIGLCLYRVITGRSVPRSSPKWQEMRRKRITLPQTVGNTDTRNSCCTSAAKAEKGCFVVHSSDQKRLLLPLQCLNNQIILELFEMAELIEYAITLIKQQVTRDIEKALLTSIASSFCSLSSNLQHQRTNHQIPICSF
uniref:Uncharacterized protein n=1 Tax=Manihot esculenta TaxID=3983 RepID=A0A2C9VIC2_MANES